MTDKIIDEVMGLVDRMARTAAYQGLVPRGDMDGIRAKLREVLEKKPLALYQRDTIKANAWKETRDGGYWDANEIISATERAHQIGAE